MFLFIMGCTRDEIVSEKEYAFVKTHPVEILSDGAVFKAEMLNRGSEKIQKYGFVWGESSGPATSDNFMAFDEDTGNGIYTFELHSGLKKGKTYFLRAYVKNFFYETYGNEVSFISNGSLPPVIESFSPDYGPIGTKVIIEGKNFARSKDGNVVKFGNNNAVIDSFSENRLVVKIPNIVKPELVKVSVEVAGMEAISEKEFDLWFPWKRKNNHRELIYHAESCVYKNKGYVIYPESKALHVYDPEQDSWSQIEIPVIADIPFIFSKDDKIYTLLKDSFWEFTPQTGTWVAKKKFPGIIKSYSGHNFSFAIDRKLYIGNCYQSFALWEYSIDNDTWTRKSDIPDKDDIFINTTDNYSFSLNNLGYVGIHKTSIEKNALWEYNPTEDNWSQKTKLPGYINYDFTVFVINNEAFVGLSRGLHDHSTTIWKFDQKSYQWIGYRGCPDLLDVSTSFVIENKGYAISLETNNYINYILSVWEFDPSKN
jgi:hypothetical protein